MTDDFNSNLEKAFDDCDGSTAYSMERDRVYDGQAHTNSGLRGAVKVEGLTMRDVCDCIVKGFLDAGGIEKELPIYNDVYSIDLNEVSPIAVVQNAMCHVEKMMGIYPNIPKANQ